MVLVKEFGDNRQKTKAAKEAQKLGTSKALISSIIS